MDMIRKFSEGKASALLARLLGTLLLVLPLVFTASCSLAEDEALLSQAELPDAVFLNYRRQDMRAGALSFVAQADRAEYYREKGLLVVYGLKFEDWSDDGKTIVAQGEAGEARYFEDSGDAVCSGTVRIRSIEENASFEIDSLEYFSATETLEGAPESQAIVRLGEKLFLKGSGFFADIRDKAFAFRGGVEGTINTSARKGMDKGVER